MSNLTKIIWAIVLAVVSVTFSSSGLARAVAAHAWSTERFSSCTNDPRIFCEPGSESFARAVAILLPTAIVQVEERQYSAFFSPIRIYTYSSRDSYALYSGTRGGSATTSFGEVHLAPAMQAIPTQYGALLAHELSHLHLAQRAGTMAMMRLPNWFTEGWATLISGGGGAGIVRPEQAIFALVHGRHFTPRDAESLLFPSNASDFNLSGTMYYRQASLLVDYLQRRNPKAFRDLISNIETGQRFGPALVKVYGQPLTVLWKDFQTDLRCHSAAKWENG